MGRYAADTNVSVEKSRAEIEGTLSRYGADRFMSGWETGMAYIGFEAHGRRVRFELPIPRRDDPEFVQTPTGKERSESAAFTAWEQSCRQRWRALGLVIKAKLEAVEVGIAEFESEFLANIVMPDNRTVGEHTRPLIAQAYESGKAVALLPPPERKDRCR